MEKTLKPKKKTDEEQKRKPKPKNKNEEGNKRNPKRKNERTGDSPPNEKAVKLSKKGKIKHFILFYLHINQPVLTGRLVINCPIWKSGGSILVLLFSDIDRKFCTVFNYCVPHYCIFCWQITFNDL